MGNCFSSGKDGRDDISELARVGRAGRHRLEPQLDRIVLVRALRNVAGYLRKERLNITVVAVGGAVNTIYLRDRGTTHDIDFFNKDLSRARYSQMAAAIQYATSRDVALESGWMNNRTALFI